jgi:hypothetical protein
MIGTCFGVDQTPESRRGHLHRELRGIAGLTNALVSPSKM